MEQTFELIAKTFQGLEEVLAQELIELGADDVQIGRRMVSFSGNQEMMYRANFCLRTAVRILKPIKHFKAKDADGVYAAVKSIDWSQYLDIDTSFVVDTTVYSTEFRNSKFVAYKVKDAIVDYFMETRQKRPNISISNPDLRLNMHISEESCTLSLDSSGESLHQRGYREATVEAPINEVLAAALIKMSGWKFDCDFVDPFCGSGTLLVEAALMARNIYPGVFRKKFGFENWKDFNPELFRSIFDDDSQEREFHHKIYGYDLNLRAVEAAQTNAKSAGVADIVSIEQREIAAFIKPEKPTIMVTNPPYGERLRPEDLSQIYRTLGEKLKKEFQGNDAWIISSKEELFDAMRLRPSFKVMLQNGALDCELRKYVTFEGRLDSFRGDGGIVKTEEERKRMGEKGRFRDGRKREFSRKRGDFSDREPDFENRDEHREPDFADNPEMAAAYRNLRARHNTFERVRNAKERAERGYERPQRFERDGERKFGDRKFGNRDSKFSERGDRKFNRSDRQFGEKDHRFGDRNRKFGNRNDHGKFRRRNDD